MKPTEEIIKSIPIDKANLEHIASTGKINGSLQASIEKVMDTHASEVAVEFAEWAGLRYKNNGNWWSDNGKNYFNTSELFEKFKSEIK